jgi:uncharacterized membrane protein
MSLKSTKEQNIHRLFEISVLLKGLHALLELVGGLFLLFVSTGTIVQVLTWLTQDELVEDPHDIIARYFIHAGEQLSAGKRFASLYLLSHGIIKIALVIGLLKNKLWAYPCSIVVLGLFMIYQTYRYTYTHAIGLVALTIFDAIVLWLIWHEYRLVAKSR